MYESDEATQPAQQLAVADLAKGFPEPRAFGAYRVFGRLGRGGMGQVLDARSPDGRPVALKLIDALGGIEETKSAVARLRREAKILGTLDIPGVVRVIDFGFVDQVCYLAMERIDGKPLSSLLEHAPLGVDLVVSLGMKLAETLAHIHELGIVHRDIKPENIMVDASGSPTLIDFGIAKAFSSDAITKQGQILGTPGYMAPEILYAGEPTAQTDQYALGRLLFTLCAGRKRRVVCPAPKSSHPDARRETGRPISRSLSLHRRAGVFDRRGVD
jgi:eukaryotic-like serine/threonine-protein kinase